MKAANTTFVHSLMSRVTVCSFLVFGIFFTIGSRDARAGLFEGFEDLSTLLTTGGWVNINHSSPINAAAPGWFQCTGTQIAPAVAGTTNSCVSVNFNTGTGVATLNDWLIGPVMTFNEGDTISFYTRTITGNPYPDRLQVRLSPNGASTNVGTLATDVGDFTMLLLDINAAYDVGAYPDFWFQYTATITGLSGPTSGRFAFRYFVEDGGPNGDNSYIVGLDSVAVASAQHIADYDGDGKMDPTVVRIAGGASGQATWYIQKSSDGSSYAQPWGLGSDFFVPGDFDGDKKTDIAVWRPGAPFEAYFYILQSATNTVRADQFGQTSDDPTVIGDYDGDGKDDPAVYRNGASPGEQSYWFFRASTGGQSGQIIYNQFGQNGDFPAPGDYNGDKKNDFCVQRNDGSGRAQFFTRVGNGGVASPASDNSVVYGLISDVIVPGDYDGDGRTDIAVVRGSGGLINWYVLPSGTGEITSSPFAIFGVNGLDQVCQGDWDGDGRTDAAVWRPNADPAQNYYYVLGSTFGEMPPAEWGQQDDYPVANYNTH